MGQQRRRQGRGLAPLALGGGLVLAILATLVELAQGDAVRASIDALWWVSGGECQFERTIEVGHRLPMHDARCPARCAWDRDRSNRLMDPIPLLTSRTCVRRVDSNKQRLGASGAAQAQALHGHGRATTAGNELYLLASNFLLYTALVGLSLRFDGMLGPTACSHTSLVHTHAHTRQVIVAIMICKLYLEAEPNASPRCVLSMRINPTPSGHTQQEPTNRRFSSPLPPHTWDRSRARQYSSHDVLELFAGSRTSTATQRKGSSILDFNKMEARILWMRLCFGGVSGAPMLTYVLTPPPERTLPHPTHQPILRRCSRRASRPPSGCPQGSGARRTCCAPWASAPRASSPPSSSGASSRSACSPCPTGALVGGWMMESPHPQRQRHWCNCGHSNRTHPNSVRILPAGTGSTSPTRTGWSSPTASSPSSSPPSSSGSLSASPSRSARCVVGRVGL